jgi:adenylate cyclase
LIHIAARLEGVAKPGAICLLEDAYRQVKSRLEFTVSDLGETQLKNIAEPIRVYSVEVARPAQVKQPSTSTPPRLSILVLPFANQDLQFRARKSGDADDSQVEAKKIFG